MKLWGGRFGKDTDALVNEFNLTSVCMRQIFMEASSTRKCWVIRESSRRKTRTRS